MYITAKIETLTDEQIIELYKKDAQKVFVGELYKRYTKFIFLVSMKYLKNEERSKDAVMEVFEKLFSDLLKHQIQNFKPWLHTVVRNHCLILLRKEQSVLNKDKKFQIEQDLFVESDEDLHHVNENKTEENLKEALNSLKNEQKVCLELFYLQEKSYNEIVDITGYSIKNVKSYIQNGKRNLKICLLKISAIIVFLVYFLGKIW
ncbi:MAG: sigma-70 family RNA polymerase sigma factor [Bacteroidales bacterium]|nr:sigma-70 family RNA polymerase sigma factor [Bacteroidales bacterium]MBN2757674.1 sigma-70 family RNA polymerase sigma factor [Bacteroidales bacterium]